MRTGARSRRDRAEIAPRCRRKLVGVQTAAVVRGLAARELLPAIVFCPSREECEVLAAVQAGDAI